MKKNFMVILVVSLFGLSACGVIASPTPTPLPTALPSATIVSTDTPSPTPSPFVLKATDVPTPTAMPKNDGTIPVASLSKDATQEEIAKALFTQWLERAKIAGTLDDYEVIKVNVIAALSGADYGVDFVAGVAYSVRPSKDKHSEWAAGNGLVVDGDPWIRGKSFFIGVRRDNDVYVLDIIGTGP